ncbi:MAG: hypothetical protein VKJ02_10250 [Snowella sp.]|nr:hypothetical protein [Snowella sp.]
MSEQFFEKLILNSPYGRPTKHWELDKNGLPTQKIIDQRRPANFLTPIPQSRKQKAVQQTLDVFDTHSKNGELSLFINSIRDKVNQWRNLPENNNWKVTPITKALLTDWQHHQSNSFRPFFCQLEAVETAILKLFCNYDDLGDRLSRPRTLLIDSKQLESGDALFPILLCKLMMGTLTL